MNRREFFGLTAVASGAALLTQGCASGGLRPQGAEDDFSLDQLQAGMTAGRVSSRTLTQSCLTRIASKNQRGPKLSAIIATNPDALDTADALDLERRSKSVRGPLHGIPVLLKDNIDTADRMPTTAGSLALEGTIAPKDAWVTRRLRDAGAIILGKANLSEWANIRSPHSSSGWSAIGGQALNPYVLNRSTSGSSSGSAAAVAAGWCPVSIGTETDGSIVSPSACCSVVGLKPTLGLVSRSGIIPIAHSQDTAGPIARTVSEAALLLGAIAGEDPADLATAACNGHVHSDYTRFLDPQGLRGVRIGVGRQFFGVNQAVDELIEHQLATLRDLGAELVDPVMFPNHGKFDDAEFEVMLFELKADLAAYLKTRGDTVSVHTLADVIAFNRQNREREMPFFGQETFLKAEAKGSLADDAYRKARERCLDLAKVNGIDAVMNQHRLDAVVAPTESSPPWLIDHINGDHYGGGCSSMPAVAGCPHLTVPAGYVRGLPVGLSFFGRAWSEPELLCYGFAFEQATRSRRPPQFLEDVANRV